MPRFPFLVLVVCCGMLMTACGNDILGTNGLGGAADRVFLLDVEGLDAPAVSTAERVYATAASRSLDDGSRYVSFRVVVAAADGRRLRVRLVDTDLQSQAELRRVGTPSSSGDDAVDQEALQQAGGVFWTTADASEPLAWTVHVQLLEEAISAYSQLEVFTQEGDSGESVLGSNLLIVPGFFYMASIGDSIQWGNGLREKEKFRVLVAEKVRQETGLYVVLQVNAHSGAKIVPDEQEALCTINCWGEVPTAQTSAPTPICGAWITKTRWPSC